MTEGLHRFYGGNDLHFLTFSCYRRRPLLRNQTHCDLFLKLLDRVRRRYRFVVLGYVVMPEHVHLLVSESQRETLSTAIQALKLGVVRSMQCLEGTLPGLAKSARSGAPQACGTPVSEIPVHPDRFWQARFDGVTAKKTPTPAPNTTPRRPLCPHLRHSALSTTEFPGTAS